MTPGTRIQNIDTQQLGTVLAHKPNSTPIPGLLPVIYDNINFVCEHTPISKLKPINQ